MSKSALPPAEVYAPHPPPGYHSYPTQSNYHPPQEPQPIHQHHHQTSAPAHNQNISFAPVTNQPISQASNLNVNVGNRVVVGVIPKRPWTTNLCACMQDIEVCMMAWCLTPCFLARLAKEMGECVCTPCCIPTALMAMRVQVRAANNIRGSIWEDFFLTNCCPLLTMCQMKREMDNVALKKPGTQLPGSVPGSMPGAMM
ncbi:cornifelin-like [Ruditapes philippinarum]|uniref:cornifelin-like n=1 Tax=Ruditapes philippinarum TaxID=129788 RepID=UPI00295B8A7C|nr:cornifelin-like [Ruditapes philippinarum]